MQPTLTPQLTPSSEDSNQQPTLTPLFIQQQSPVSSPLSSPQDSPRSVSGELDIELEVQGPVEKKVVDEIQQLLRELSKLLAGVSQSEMESLLKDESVKQLFTQVIELLTKFLPQVNFVKKQAVVPVKVVREENPIEKYLAGLPAEQRPIVTRIFQDSSVMENFAHLSKLMNSYDQAGNDLAKELLTKFIRKVQDKVSERVVQLQQDFSEGESQEKNVVLKEEPKSKKIELTDDQAQKIENLFFAINYNVVTAQNRISGGNNFDPILFKVLSDEGKVLKELKVNFKSNVIVTSHGEAVFKFVHKRITDAIKGYNYSQLVDFYRNGNIVNMILYEIANDYVGLADRELFKEQVDDFFAHMVLRKRVDLNPTKPSSSALAQLKYKTSMSTFFYNFLNMQTDLRRNLNALMLNESNYSFNYYISHDINSRGVKELIYNPFLCVDEASVAHALYCMLIPELPTSSKDLQSDVQSVLQNKARMVKLLQASISNYIKNNKHFTINMLDKIMTYVESNSGSKELFEKLLSASQLIDNSAHISNILVDKKIVIEDLPNGERIISGIAMEGLSAPSQELYKRLTVTKKSVEEKDVLWLSDAIKNTLESEEVNFHRAFDAMLAMFEDKELKSIGKVFINNVFLSDERKMSSLDSIKLADEDKNSILKKTESFAFINELSTLFEKIPDISKANQVKQDEVFGVFQNPFKEKSSRKEMLLPYKNLYMHIESQYGDKVNTFKIRDALQDIIRIVFYNARPEMFLFLEDLGFIGKGNLNIDALMNDRTPAARIGLPPPPPGKSAGPPPPPPGLGGASFLGGSAKPPVLSAGKKVTDHYKAHIEKYKNYFKKLAALAESKAIRLDRLQGPRTKIELILQKTQYLIVSRQHIALMNKAQKIMLGELDEIFPEVRPDNESDILKVLKVAEEVAHSIMTLFLNTVNFIYAVEPNKTNINIEIPNEQILDVLINQVIPDNIAKQDIEDEAIREKIKEYLITFCRDIKEFALNAKIISFDEMIQNKDLSLKEGEEKLIPYFVIK